MKPRISVIITVYNTEQYLDKCIQSVINQTYQKLEIILIDDGSTDCSLQVCEKWAKLDSRIVVVHKSNGGVSSARNAGIENSHGDYIFFLDSDDWIEVSMIEEMIKSCEEYHVLISACGRYDYFEKNEKYMVSKCPSICEAVDSEKYVSKMLLGKECDSSVCDKIFHKTLWDGVRFPEGKIYEDVAILYKVVLKAKRVATVDKPLYYYRRHLNSITTSGFSETLLSYPYNTRKLLKDIKVNYEGLYVYACWTHTKAIQNVLYKLAISSKEIYNKYLPEFRQLSKELAQYKKIWATEDVFGRRDRLLCHFFSIWFLIRPVYNMRSVVYKIIKKANRI